MKNFLSGDVSFQKRVLCDFQQSLNYKNFSSATSFPFIAATRAGISPQFEVGLWRRMRQSVVLSVVHNHLGDYPTPKTITYFWGFGSLAGIFLGLQIVTGLILTFHYAPNTLLAFDVLEHIMRDVNYGWLFRFAHCNGASFFFIAVYTHLARAFYYNSFAFPRQHLWYSGVTIFLLMMAAAFMGYVLPWGQMSFWGATVITNLFSAIPLIGDSVAEWLWGGFSVDNATLNRFYGLHFVVPFAILGLVFVHLIFLHDSGSLDPVVGLRNTQDKLPFYPYFVVKDAVGLLIFLVLFFFCVFFTPDLLGHPDNYIEGNALVTPAHIVPEWYFLPFYAMLRSVPDKLGGVICMAAAIVAWYAIPVPARFYITTSYNFYWLCFVGTFFVTFVFLGWLGSQSVKPVYVFLGQFFTLYYFFWLFAAVFFFPYFAKFLVSIPKPKKLTFSFLAPVVLLSGAELDHFFSWDVNPNFFILIVLSLNFLLVLFFFFLFGKVVNLKLSFWRFFQIECAAGFWAVLASVFSQIKFWFYPFLHVSLFLVWFLALGVNNLVYFFFLIEFAGAIPLILMGLAHRVTSLTTIVFSLRYSLLNLFCSALFLFGMFIQYVLFGTTEFLQIENLLSYYSVYHSSETFFFWLSSVSLLLMLSPILLKLGFFPFNALITDVYPGVSFPFFTGYATFYNFGVLLIFFYLLFGPYSVLFSFLLPYLFVVLLGTLAVSIIGFVVVDYSFQSSLGLLSAGTSSLVILVFLSVITFFDTDFVETTASLLGGLFFYFLTLYFFLNFVNSAASNYSFSTFKVIGDFKNLKFNSVTISFFLFLLSGLPPTVIFFFKLAVFANTLQFAILLIAVLGQVTFLFLYAKWASAVLTDVKLIAQSTSSSLAEAVPLAWFLPISIFIFLFSTSDAYVVIGHWLFNVVFYNNLF